VDNSGELARIDAQVAMLHRRYLELASRRSAEQ
jgi:hypothetical protein